MIDFDGKNLRILGYSKYPGSMKVLLSLATNSDLFIDLKLSDWAWVHLCPKI